MEEQPSKSGFWRKHPLYYLSPGILIILAAIFMIISGHSNKEKSGGWSMLAAILGMRLLFTGLIVDIIVKCITQNVLAIWFIEVILFVACWYLFKIYI